MILVMALGLFFVVLTASALALDYGNGLLQKRRLQNAADSAALGAADVLAKGGSVDDAVSQAQSLVSTNTGGRVSLAYPGTGSGANLTDGIDLSGGDVRVVLRRSISTFFASVAGVSNLAVGARSRAVVGPFGGLPIAAKRFSAGDTSNQLGTGGNPATVEDYLLPASLDSISAWPSPLSSPAAPSAGYSPPSAYNPGVSGVVFPILGQGSQANVGSGNDFHGFLALDVRAITNFVPTFFNGVTSGTSIQQLKTVESGYFTAGGYPGPNPLVGDQIGVLNGANVSQTVDAARKAYQRGDIVAAIVYDGTVYRKPSFDLGIDSAVKTSPDIGPTGSPLTFQITLTPINGFVSSGVQFSGSGLEGWANWQFNSGGANTVYSVPVSGNTTVTLQVSASTTVQGVRTALIKAYDPNTGNFRTLNATVVVGSSPAYSLSSAEGYAVIEQGSSARFDLYLEGWNGYPTTDVVVNTPLWYTTDTPPVQVTQPSGITVSQPSTVQVRDGHSSNLRMTVSASDSAAVGGWLMYVSVSDGNPSNNQYMYLNVQTVLSSSGPSAGSTTSFVYVLGYANLVITYANNASSPDPNLDNNTLYGYFVSPLVSSATTLGKGLNARLVSWNQTVN